MPTNVEIKARNPDPEGLRTLAISLSCTPEERLVQEDVFFACATGRLKLRIFDSGAGELILYERPAGPSPRPCRYTIAPTPDPGALRQILSATLPELGCVRKERILYRVGQTRVHLDSVEGLGEFVELEVVLREDQPEEEGVRIAHRLMDRLGIRSEHLLAGSYFDMLPTSPDQDRDR
ncbi:MAG TPA: class IV adenylate cyclase [Longimicrobiaceae bacterium]|nr:class IV adenylate cyclase [Longimicrobiaceae bacterium]